MQRTMGQYDSGQRPHEPHTDYSTQKRSFSEVEPSDFTDYKRLCAQTGTFDHVQNSYWDSTSASTFQDPAPNVLPSLQSLLPSANRGYGITDINQNSVYSDRNSAHTNYDTIHSQSPAFDRIPIDSDENSARTNHNTNHNQSAAYHQISTRSDQSFPYGSYPSTVHGTGSLVYQESTTNSYGYAQQGGPFSNFQTFSSSTMYSSYNLVNSSLGAQTDHHDNPDSSQALTNYPAKVSYALGPSNSLPSISNLHDDKPSHNLEVANVQHGHGYNLISTVDSTKVDETDFSLVEYEPQLNIDNIKSDMESTFDDLEDIPNTTSQSTLQHDQPQTSRTPDIDNDTSPTISIPADTCFGVIIVKTSASEFIFENGVASVTARPIGSLLKLNHLDGKYAGLVECGSVCALIDKYNVELNASVIEVKQPKKDAAKSRRELAQRSSRLCEVRLVLYGQFVHLQSVGNHLSDAGLFLQQPSIGEIKHDVTYNNPHYLIRPGAEMPKLDDLSISVDKTSSNAGLLNEVDKNRYMRLFDDASFENAATDVQLSPRIRTTLKEHQTSGVAMMIEKERGVLRSPKYPTIWEPTSELEPIPKYMNSLSGQTMLDDCDRFRHVVTGLNDSHPKPVLGGILADDMGLGKSLTLLSLVCSSLDVYESFKGTGGGQYDPPRVSKVGYCANLDSTTWLGTTNHKVTDRSHTEKGSLSFQVYIGVTRQATAAKFETNNVVLTTYETMRSDWQSGGPLFKKTWDRIVLDEAHRIRNRFSQTFKSACALNARYRWCLTGTPIQNSLDDYGALLGFLKIPFLEQKKQFDFWIADPVNKKKPRSLERLKDLVRATCLRRTKNGVQSSLQLPVRTDCLQELDFDPETREIHAFFAKMASQIVEHNRFGKLGELPDQQAPKDRNVLRLIVFMRLACNHGLDLLPQGAVAAYKARDIEHSEQALLNSATDTCITCGDKILVSTGTPLDETFDIGSSTCAKCREDSLGDFEEDSYRDTTAAKDTTLSRGLLNYSPKLNALLITLAREVAPESASPDKPRKSVVFSYWTKMLDIIQGALRKIGFDFARLDGNMSVEERKMAMDRFNNDRLCKVMLASISSAGEGVDLTIANHIHLMEPHYNPMAEAQAIDRVHRIGQKNEVFVTRYVIKDSIETYVTSEGFWLDLEAHATDIVKHIQWVQRHKLQLISDTLENTHKPQSEINNERLEKLQKVLQRSSAL